MSGKHTAAQGEYGDKINRLCWNIRHAKSLAWRDSLFEQLIELIDPSPGRATEGRAQTSAALSDGEIVTVFNRVQGRWSNFGGPLNAVLKFAREILATQLADSTALGAPVDGIETPMHFWWRSDVGEWRECMGDAQGAVLFVGTVPPGYKGTFGNYDAAPTAQQSLTAGVTRYDINVQDDGDLLEASADGDVYKVSDIEAAFAAQSFTAGGAALAEMAARKDAAYLERNQVVAALAKAYPSGVARTAIEGWSEDWHGCVYIDLPTGQASWHFHDSQAYLFDGLPPYAGKWDGHNTDEKYRRLSQLAAAPLPQVQSAKYEYNPRHENGSLMGWFPLDADSDKEAEAESRGYEWRKVLPQVQSEAVGEYLACCDHPDCSKCAGRGGIYRVAKPTGGV